MHLDEVVSCAGWESSDIAVLILVGGAIRVPLVQKVIKEELPHARILDGVDPDLAVAQGAVKHALAIMEAEQPLVSRNPTTTRSQPNDNQMTTAAAVRLYKN